MDELKRLDSDCVDDPRDERELCADEDAVPVLWEVADELLDAVRLRENVESEDVVGVDELDLESVAEGVGVRVRPGLRLEDVVGVPVRDMAADRDPDGLAVVDLEGRDELVPDRVRWPVSVEDALSQ